MATVTPKAVTMPSTMIERAPDVFRARKPMAVVIEVMTTGRRRSSIVRVAASLESFAVCARAMKAWRMCTPSATPTAINRIGSASREWVMAMPAQPIAPIAHSTDAITTSSGRITPRRLEKSRNSRTVISSRAAELSIPVSLPIVLLEL